jgi:DNA-binding transcriptional ArsR family regulator
LANGEKSVTDIADAVGASLQSTSQHLRLMRETGILESRREGQLILYRLATVDGALSCPLLARAAETT